MTTQVIIKAQFEATHAWPHCDLPEVDFLRYRHRHIFHVTMKWKVEHADRDIEFISRKRKVEAFLRDKWEGSNSSYSCEDFATMLLERFNATYVSVFEDNENGAEVYV